MRIATVALASALVLSGRAANAADFAVGGKRVQCWTDNQGQRACGDAVPSQYVQKQREVFDDQGRVREVKPREKTAEEAEAEQQAAHDAAEAAQWAQKQRDYDHFLLSTYNDSSEIERARDERVAMLDGRQQLAEKLLADSRKAIEQQQARIDAVRRNGKTPGAALTTKLDELKKTMVGNQRVLDGFARDKQQVAEKYNADLARYRELQGISAAKSVQ
jgi:hypothetical protein